MASRDKLDQFIKLFGLVAMKGRAKSSPLLRKKKVADIDAEIPDGDDMDICVLADIDEEGEVVVPEAGRHDVEVWPHMHSAELQAKLFPVAVAVPEIETIDEEAKNEPLGHQRVHRCGSRGRDRGGEGGTHTTSRWFR